MADLEIPDIETAQGGPLPVAAGDKVHAFRSPNSRVVTLEAQLPATPASSSAPASQRFHEDVDNGSHYVALKAPDSLAGNVDVVLPSAAGTLALTADLSMSTKERRNSLLRACGIAKALNGYQRDLDTVAVGFAVSGDADGTSSGGAVDTSAKAWKTTAAATDTRATLTFSSNDPGYTDHNHRVRFGASELSTSGTAFRLTLYGPSSGTALSVTGMRAGHKASSGDAIDFDGTQVAVTVGGSATFSVGAGATVVTDWITYALDETKDFVVAFHTNGGDIRRRANVDATNYDWWTKGGATEVATSDVSGYFENGSSDMAMVGRIEVQTGSAADGTLIIPYQTADAARTKVRGTFEIDNVSSGTLGTDWTVEYTCNGGTNWSAAATYTNCGRGQSGRTVVETDEVTCTSGTSFSARVKNLNGDMIHVHKAALEAAA